MRRRKGARPRPPKRIVVVGATSRWVSSWVVLGPRRVAFVVPQVTGRHPLTIPLAILVPIHCPCHGCPLRGPRAWRRVHGQSSVHTLYRRLRVVEVAGASAS